MQGFFGKCIHMHVYKCVCVCVCALRYACMLARTSESVFISTSICRSLLLWHIYVLLFILFAAIHFQLLRFGVFILCTDLMKTNCFWQNTFFADFRHQSQLWQVLCACVRVFVRVFGCVFWVLVPHMHNQIGCYNKRTHLICHMHTHTHTHAQTFAYKCINFHFSFARKCSLKFYFGSLKCIPLT